MSLNRRQFVKYSSFASFVLGYTLNSNTLAHDLLKNNSKRTKDSSSGIQDDPIQNISIGDSSSLDFNGDNIDRPHDILWDVDGYIQRNGGLPEPTIFTHVVVAGGGMSGLLSAYHLKHLSPVLLEQDKHFGGNSKGEKFGKSEYSIGAAYVTLPDEGSEIEQFFKELNLTGKFRIESDQETSIIVKNKMMKDFWEGASDPENANDFKRVAKELRRIYDEAYPEIPWVEGSDVSYAELCRLDNMSFEQWITETFGAVHPHILEYFQSYCWSSFVGSIDEISAAQALNFITAEVDGVMALPGGNACITQALHQVLRNTLPQGHVVSGAFVIKVAEKNNGKVWVTYEDVNKKFITIECDKVICAFPKFVAKYVVEGLSLEKQDAFRKMIYRGYLVTNAIFNKKFESVGYDIFSLKGKFSESPTPQKPQNPLTTDVCFGTWAQNDQVDYSVMTMYRPLPYDGGRQFLFSPMAHQKHLIQSQEELAQFCSVAGYDIKDVKGYRLTRWGHSVPLAGKGMISSGAVAKIAEPINDKIYFVNQDNWVNPAFECCFSESLSVAQAIQS